MQTPEEPDGLRDPKFYITLDPPEYSYGNGVEPLIFITQENGKWTGIPCAHDADSLEILISEYFNQRQEKDKQKLDVQNSVATGMLPYSEFATVQYGPGLFLYGPPDEFTDIQDEEGSRGDLVRAMIEAGLDPEQIPYYLFPSILTYKDKFLDYEGKDSFIDLDDLLDRTYVLTLAVSAHEEGHLDGKTLGLGIQSAIGLTGQAVVESLPRDSFRNSTVGNRVYFSSQEIKEHIKNLIAGEI